MKNLLRYKDSRNWHYRFYDDHGKRRTISLETDDEAVAIQKARAFDAGATIRRIQNIDLRTGGIQKTMTNIWRRQLLEEKTQWARRRLKLPERF
jgi:hypothetical protein